jgi:uncharacterized protein (TIGR02391 family)
VITVRHGDEFVPSADVAAMPTTVTALKLLIELDRRRTAHPPQPGFKLDWIVRNSLVRWEENGVRSAGALADKLADALGWLISQALIAPSLDEHVWRVSELGRRIARDRDLSGLHAERRLGVELHDRLKNARSIFSLGTYDAAILEAMKQVEERVRELSGLAGSGVDLMHRAFSPGKAGSPPGPLADATAPDPNENRGLMELFSGAMGAFRNPAAHRPVDYADPTEAVEVVLLADLLLRMLDRVEGRLAP